MINHHHQASSSPLCFQIMSQLLNAVSDDISQVTLTNWKALGGPIKPTPGAVRCDAGGRKRGLVSFPHGGHGWIGAPTVGWAWGHWDLGQGMVFGKESDRALGPRWDVIIRAGAANEVYRLAPCIKTV